MSNKLKVFYYKPERYLKLVHNITVIKFIHSLYGSSNSTKIQLIMKDSFANYNILKILRMVSVLININKIKSLFRSND